MRGFQLAVTAAILWLLLRHVTWDDLVQMRDRIASLLSLLQKQQPPAA